MQIFTIGLLHKSSMKVLGIILLIFGFTIWYAIGRRRFNRRTITGAEVFRSYESALLTKLGESTAIDCIVFCDQWHLCTYIIL